MERGKTVCCGLSARSVAMRVVFIGMIIVTAVCLTLTILMFTKKKHTGKSRHTPGTESQMPVDSKSNSIYLSDVEPTPMPSQETTHKPYLIGVGRADCTGPPAEIPLVSFELELGGPQAGS